jgi:hypothetical protein
MGTSAADTGPQRRYNCDGNADRADREQTIAPILDHRLRLDRPDRISAFGRTLRGAIAPVKAVPNPQTG